MGPAIGESIQAGCGMSLVTFQTAEAATELRGAERAYANILCNQIAWAALSVDRLYPERDPVFGLLPDDSYLRALNGHDLLAAWETWFMAGMMSEAKFQLPDSRCLDVWDVALSTAVAIGNDQLRLLARLHAQCEIFGWVAGQDREWLAGIIADGLTTGLLREGVGWQEVAAMLEADTKEPVVTSYSVTESFPDAWWVAEAEGNPITPETQEEREEQWYSLSDKERWRRAVPLLPKGAPRWCVQNWGNGFGHGLTVWDLRRMARAENPA